MGETKHGMQIKSVEQTKKYMGETKHGMQINSVEQTKKNIWVKQNMVYKSKVLNKLKTYE